VTRLWLHLVLFLATVISTFGSHFASRGDLPGSDRIEAAALFSFCVMLILGAHEMGHYLMARHHQVDSSLPYFIPVPLGFGTMGAVIRLKGRIPTRNALVDIGAAGPLAGLLIAIPLFAIGLRLCPIIDAPPAPALIAGPMSAWTLVPRLFSLFFEADQPVAELRETLGDNLITWGLQRALVGPLPDGRDLAAHSVLLAAWFGMLVTMLNLVPIGQLDGGHLTHAWFGERAITVGKVMALGMGVLVVFFSFSWLLWLLLATKVVGFKHPEVILADEPLSPGRKAVCALCFVLFVLTLMPVPLGVSL
jgi:membrane-associated protease RseP (regulator of RpoE activity)